jgi:hypothetical protein
VLWNCAAVPEGFAVPEGLLCGFAVGCEDSEDTGFCPLRIMGCAPEQPRVLEFAKQAASETFSFATNRNYSISHCFVIR